MPAALRIICRLVKSIAEQKFDGRGISAVQSLVILRVIAPSIISGIRLSVCLCLCVCLYLCFCFCPSIWPVCVCLCLSVSLSSMCAGCSHTALFPTLHLILSHALILSRLISSLLNLRPQYNRHSRTYHIVSIVSIQSHSSHSSQFVFLNPTCWHSLTTLHHTNHMHLIPLAPHSYRHSSHLNEFISTTSWQMGTGQSRTVDLPETRTNCRGQIVAANCQSVPISRRLPIRCLESSGLLCERRQRDHMSAIIWIRWNEYGLRACNERVWPIAIKWVQIVAANCPRFPKCWILWFVVWDRVWKRDLNEFVMVEFRPWFDFSTDWGIGSEVSHVFDESDWRRCWLLFETDHKQPRFGAPVSAYGKGWRRGWGRLV